MHDKSCRIGMVFSSLSFFVVFIHYRIISNTWKQVFFLFFILLPYIVIQVHFICIVYLYFIIIFILFIFNFIKNLFIFLFKIFAFLVKNMLLFSNTLFSFSILFISSFLENFYFFYDGKQNIPKNFFLNFLNLFLFLDTDWLPKIDLNYIKIKCSWS